jgi:large subunit ribosomal protein L35
MPKMKSHRGARKTFKVTSSGKIKRRHMNKSHILTSKTRKRKRQLRRAGMISPADATKVKRLLVV